MPLIEAMRMGTPVLCSDCSSLSEVGGDAVLMFDARKSQTIVTALIQLVTTPTIRIHLQTSGILRAKDYSNSQTMTKEYLDFLLAFANNKTGDSPSSQRFFAVSL